MQKSLFLVCALIVSSANAEIVRLSDTKASNDVSVNQTTTGVNVAFHIGQVDVTNSNFLSAVRFKDLKFNELNTASNVGTPALPYHSVILKGHPSDYQVAINLGREYYLDETVPAPTEAQKFRCVDCEQPETVVDWTSYENEEDNFYKVEFLGDFRGTPLTKITVTPAKFIARKDLTVVYADALFSIRNVDSVKGRRWSADDYFKSFATPDEIVLEADLNKKMLILTPEYLREDLKAFVDHKTELGYEVKVANLEEVGKITASNVDKFIAKEYKENKFTYVILVGHEDSMPTNYRRTTGGRTPTDLPYFTFGEEHDFIPDVFAARWAVEDASELKAIIDKTIEFEKKAWKNKNGVNRSIGLVSAEGYQPSDFDYMTQFLKNLKGIEPTVISEKKYHTSNPETLTAAFDKGAIWMNYLGHGSGYSWQSMFVEFESDHVQDLSNEDQVKPIIIDGACLNGNFRHGTSRLGMTLMNSKKGAVAYYGGSVSISWDPPAVMSYGITKVVGNKEVKHLGEALLAGQFYMMKNTYDQRDIENNFTWYHLQGDPTLELDFIK